MTEGAPDRIELPGEGSVALADLDMGMRSVAVDGAEHAVVMDVHPPTRFLPREVVEVLEEAIDTTEGERFGTPHLMGLVMEEFPDRVVVADASDDGRVGFDAVWITSVGPRELHAIVVELVVELMEHAVSHGDEDAADEFAAHMAEFDVEQFVDRYRTEREFEDEFDAPA
jgi:hypothetical protein